MVSVGLSGLAGSIGVESSGCLAQADNKTIVPKNKIAIIGKVFLLNYNLPFFVLKLLCPERND